jgi:hypothetical protein
MWKHTRWPPQRLDLIFGLNFARYIDPLNLTRMNKLGAYLIWIRKPWTFATTQYKYLCHWCWSSTSTSTANTGALTVTPKVVTLVSTIVLDSNLILKRFQCLGRVYWVLWNLEPHENVLVLISKHEFFGHIGRQDHFVPCRL